MYDTFFKRIQETSATSDLQAANARVLDKAYPSEDPVKPQKKLIIGIAALISLMLSCGMAYLLEMLNNTIRTSRDVEDKLNLPVLGVLPALPQALVKQGIGRLFLDKQQRAFIESVRTIRTSLTMSTLGQQKKVIAVTSTLPGEGKSSTAANIALALGQLSSTLIIDADLRRPTVAKTFAIKGGSAGLANVLSGHTPVSECLHTRDGIKVMPAGMIPPDPTQLFSEARFEKLVRRLSETFEVIIIDCPPMTGISDTLMITRFCDALMYVVESGRASQSAISHATGRLLQNSAPLSGVVLNKFNTQRQQGEDGYYGYYDYHGYSEPTEKQSEPKKRKRKVVDTTAVS